MRLERVASDKIKIFLTFEDLKKRGISKDEIWMDIPKVHDLFRDMISEASEQLGFEAEGSVIVEVFSLPSQGMVILVTMTDDDEFFDDAFIELQITVSANEKLIMEFDDVEDVIQLAKRLNNYFFHEGALYYYEDKYYLFVESAPHYLLTEETFIALLNEYGKETSITQYILEEYGKVIFEKQALRQLNEHFS